MSVAALCGLDATALVRSLAARAAERDQFAFISYEPALGAAERLGITPARKLFCMTIEDLWRQAGHDVDNLLNKLVGRNVCDGANRLTYVSAIELRQSQSKFPEGRNERQVVAVCSCCRREDGAERHFPMLDFRVDAPPTKEKQDLAVEVIAKALLRQGAPDGVILYSGKLDPLDEAEWRNFMLRCLLLEPLVDVRYVAHRLLSGRATLRITNSVLKPTAPRVVACLEQSAWKACPHA
jgi:hypothetical protein